jgi:hypothetical protein
MSRRRKRPPPAPVDPEIPGYDAVLSGMVELLESARRAAARSMNGVMTTTYWEMGRRIVEQEQQGHSRAAYGKTLLARLSSDLTRKESWCHAYGRVSGSADLRTRSRCFIASMIRWHSLLM